MWENQQVIINNQDQYFSNHRSIGNNQCYFGHFVIQTLSNIILTQTIIDLKGNQQFITNNHKDKNKLFSKSSEETEQKSLFFLNNNF